MQRITLLVLAGALMGTLGACNKPKPKQEAPKAARKLLKVEPRTDLAEQIEKLRLYGKDGNLLPSDDKRVGLTLPRGLRQVRELERRWFYESQVPVDKLRRYFGVRLLTGQIKPGGGGITYVEAVPREVKNGAVKISVKIGEHPSKPRVTRVEIRELKPPPTNPPSFKEVQAILRAKRRYVD